MTLQLYLTLTCLTCWLLRLNYATLPEWNECVREFYRAPGRCVCVYAVHASLCGREAGTSRALGRKRTHGMHKGAWDA